MLLVRIENRQFKLGQPENAPVNRCIEKRLLDLTTSLTKPLCFFYFKTSLKCKINKSVDVDVDVNQIEIDETNDEEASAVVIQIKEKPSK